MNRKIWALFFSCALVVVLALEARESGGVATPGQGMESLSRQYRSPLTDARPYPEELPSPGDPTTLVVSSEGEDESRDVAHELFTGGVRFGTPDAGSSATLRVSLTGTATGFLHSLQSSPTCSAIPPPPSRI